MSIELHKHLAAIAAVVACLSTLVCSAAEPPLQPVLQKKTLLTQPPAKDQESSTKEETSIFSDSQFEWDDEDCCDEGCDVDLSWLRDRIHERGAVYGGAEYLWVRPRFSQAVFEVRRTLLNDDTAVPEQSTLIDQTVEFDFDYKNSFRTFVGYRFSDCGGDVQFTYWHMTGSSNAVDGPADVNGGTLILAGQLENNPGQGQFLTGASSVTANLYDIDFAKCLPLGGPVAACDSCGDTRCCPRWDVRWTAGVRIADIKRDDSNFIGPDGGPGTTFADINATFVGAGPRVGIQGRRYFGDESRLSLYAKGNTALLIGDYKMRRVRITPGSDVVPTVTTVQLDNFSRMIPVSEIEVGAGFQVARHTFVSAGWFFQCWWDLGAPEQVDGTNFGPLDSANIMAFDGLFVRAEMLF